MSKADKDGWIRHRGGKCPVDDGTMIDIRCRDGIVKEGVVCGDQLARTSGMFWMREGDNAEVVAYRLHKPAEQVEQAEAEQVMRDCVEKCASTESAGELLYDPIAQGPLRWRDRITELDEDRKTIDALYQVNTARIETERAELVQKLAGEGFALIGRINELLTEAAQKHEDVDDPKNWKVGDELKAIGNCGGFSFAGEVVKILVVRDDGGFEVATESEPDYGWFFTEEESITDLKFHSRPSA